MKSKNASKSCPSEGIKKIVQRSLVVCAEKSLCAKMQDVKVRVFCLWLQSLGFSNVREMPFYTSVFLLLNHMLS
jgi:hypothetical protein